MTPKVGATNGLMALLIALMGLKLGVSEGIEQRDVLRDKWSLLLAAV